MPGTGPTLAEIAAEIELLETVEQFGAEVQQFTDWMANLSGGNVTNWMSNDSTVQYELGKLKDAAFDFSETLSGYADHFERLSTAAGTADTVNKVVQAATSLSTMIGRADEAVGAKKATELANVLTAMTEFSQHLTGLSLNPVIGVFIGLYAVALNTAAERLKEIEAYAAQRNEIINSRGGEIDLEAILAEQQARAESAEEARRALTGRLNQLYAQRAEEIQRLQGEQYRVALDFCASRHPEQMRKLIETASREGDVMGNASINGETLGQLESWVANANNAAFDLMTQAAAAPEGSEARQQAIDRLDRLTETRREVVEGLRPLRDCVRDALEQYGVSTADAGEPVAAASGGGMNRRIIFGGGGILAAAMVGVFLLLPGGDDGTNSPTGDSSSSSTSSSSSSSSGSGGSSSGSSGSSSSVGSEAPLLVHPCDVFSEADIAALVGPGSVGTRIIDQDRRMVCDFRPPDGGSGPLVHVEAQRNTAADGFFDEFRKQRADAVEVRPVEWSEEGELRVTVFPNPEDGISAALWAYVITTDYIGRDVFIWVQVGGQGDPDTFGAAVESIAATLKDAILEAQP